MTSITWVKRLAIALFWLALWQLAAWAAGNGLLLCGPMEALEALGHLLPLPAFWESLGCSLGRIATGFAIAAVLGALLGTAARTWPLVGEVLSPLMSVVKGAPVVCIIVLLLVLLGSSQTTIVVVALVVAPPFYVAVREAAAARNSDLDEMLKVFAVGRWRRLAAVRWPQAAPFLRAAAGSAAAMAWKAGVAAELLGLPAFSIGEQVYLAKLTLDTPSIVAWTAVAVAMGWLSEKLAMTLIDALGKLPVWWLNRRVWRAEALGPDTVPPRPEPIAVDFRGVSKSFDGHSVLQHLSLAIAAGQRMALMAPSGAGKTTFLRLALGLETPDEGIVARTPGPLSAVFQEVRLMEGLTATQNLALAATDTQELNRSLRILGELLQEAEMNKPVSQLSGGMRRRVELARALGHPAGLLVLDEPFTGLDDETRERAAAIAAEHLDGRTLLLATHGIRDAESLDATVSTIPFEA